MSVWKLYDNTGVVRSGLDEAEAHQLVDSNHEQGITEVYAVSDEGVRYHEEVNPE